MSVFCGVICCISAFYEYGQNAAKQKGAPLVCLGLLPGGEYYTHDGANTDTQRRACLFSVVHVVHIRAGGVEALAACCIKGAFGLKKPPFRAWIRPRGGGVSVFGCPRCPYRARACNLFNVWRLLVLSIFVHIVHVLRLWPPFALLWIWTHSAANIDTARAVPAFAAVSLLFSAVSY